MYSNVVRDEEYKLRFRDFIQGEYGIDVKSISATRRGFYGETWKVSSLSKHYFLKVVCCREHMHIYERSLPIIQYLCDHGVDFIGQIVKTRHGKLSAYFDDAVVGAFDWIEGENIETDETKMPEYEMLAKVYAVPHQGADFLYEDFQAGVPMNFGCACAY